MKYQVQGNRILVEPQDKDQITPGGVHLPESMKEPTIKALVVAVGQGRYTETGALIRPQSAVGDVVFFARSVQKTEVILDGNTYLILRDEDILLTIPGPNSGNRVEAPEKIEYKKAVLRNDSDMLRGSYKPLMVDGKRVPIKNLQDPGFDGKEMC